MGDHEAYEADALRNLRHNILEQWAEGEAKGYVLEAIDGLLLEADETAESAEQ